MTRPVQMFLGRSFFMYQIVCITFAGRTTIVKLKHLIIPTFQYTLLYDSEEGFNQLDEMWGKSHEVKNIHPEDTRGHLFEWGNYAMFIHWGLYSHLANKWKDRTYYGIGEWMMNEGMAGADRNEYMAVAREFNPSEFNPNRSLAL